MLMSLGSNRRLFEPKDSSYLGRAGLVTGLSSLALLLALLSAKVFPLLDLSKEDA